MSCIISVEAGPTGTMNVSTGRPRWLLKRNPPIALARAAVAPNRAKTGMFLITPPPFSNGRFKFKRPFKTVKSQKQDGFVIFVPLRCFGNSPRRASETRPNRELVGRGLASLIGDAG